MSDSPRNLLEHVQSLDEATKNRVLVAGVAVAMVIVVAVWIIYISALVPAGTASENQTQAPAAPTSSIAVSPSAPASSLQSGTSFFGGIWQGMKWMGSAVASGIKNAINAVAGMFSQPGDYSVHPG